MLNDQYGVINEVLLSVGAILATASPGPPTPNLSLGRG